MKVLTSPTETFDLGAPNSSLFETQFCIYDYTESNNRDFFFKHVAKYSYYCYPSIDILIDGKYTVSFPANWNIMSCNENNICTMVQLDELLHTEIKVPLFNPYSNELTLVSAEITKINPEYNKHFVPKIGKRNILVVPVTEDREYPLCVLAWDNVDVSKCELNLNKDIF